MTELTDFTDPTPDLTDEERNLLRRAGASEELLQLCNQSIEGVIRDDGKEVDRHSVLSEVKKYLREWENLTEENAHSFEHVGGGFFSKMWEGNLYAAYGHADYNNQALMFEQFGVRKINDDRPNHRAPLTV